MKESENKKIGDLYASLDNSKAYSIFCERVYGENLCQLNRMDKAQLEKLLKILDLSNSDLVLDLGCGIGKITEFISDMTQAHIIGIDFAAEAIRRANSRTTRKRKRLEFYEENIESLSFPSGTFSCIIAIDSLYDDMVSSLADTIHRIITLLKPNGKMGIFYTMNKDSSDSTDILEPNKTQIAQILKNQDLKFLTWEFTENEQLLLQRKKSVAKQMQEEFKLENNQEICERIASHSEKLLKRIQNGNARRFLYLVQL